MNKLNDSRIISLWSRQRNERAIPTGNFTQNFSIKEYFTHTTFLFLPILIRKTC